MICNECLQGKHLHPASVPGCNCDAAAHALTIPAYLAGTKPSRARTNTRFLSYVLIRERLRELQAEGTKIDSRSVLSAQRALDGMFWNALNECGTEVRGYEPSPIERARILETVNVIRKDLRTLLERYDAFSESLIVTKSS